MGGNTSIGHTASNNQSTFVSVFKIKRSNGARVARVRGVLMVNRLVNYSLSILFISSFIDRQRTISLHRYIGCIREIKKSNFKKKIRLSDWAKKQFRHLNGLSHLTLEFQILSLHSFKQRFGVRQLFVKGFSKSISNESSTIERKWISTVDHILKPRLLRKQGSLIYTRIQSHRSFAIYHHQFVQYCV